jgi:hypothetical protein
LRCYTVRSVPASDLYRFDLERIQAFNSDTLWTLQYLMLSGAMIALAVAARSAVPQRLPRSMLQATPVNEALCADRAPRE